jgi:TnpA family transposase
MMVVYSNMYHKIIIEQRKISNQDFSLVPSQLETHKITLEIMSNLCSKSTFVMK